MAHFMGDATSFCWAVDSAIRSETGSNFGASPARSFASVIDYALRSNCASEEYLGSSRIPSFSSGVDYVISSSSNGGTDLETSFASEVYSTTAVTEGSSAVASNVTEYVVTGLQLFSQAELAAATNNFSLHNKIGAGRLGVVYIGKLVDGREVAIKRSETWQKKKTSIKSALTFMSRLHHKHLVGLVGFCEEKYERLLVYEYMKNGSLYDHLHENGSSVLNSWKLRINIALDASRGIEYLHKYAIPLLIHGDIKSSNILLDATWMARVSDFRLSLSLEPGCYYRQIKAKGTVGYIDPEYYDVNMLTTKSDVYGLGVVLLELLTGKRAIFLDALLSVHRLVDFAVPNILAGELVKILDARVGPPGVNELEALELVAQTAVQCLNQEGKNRPSMADIVFSLERALAISYSRQSHRIYRRMNIENIVWKPKKYVM